MLGQTIFHYQILEKLGQGGMGIVYKALDTKLNRTVALKFLSPHLTLDQEAIDRFINEAQTASALDHTNICTIYEINETEDGQMFICMAYYVGETLQEKIRRGPLSIEEAIDIAMQTARGLERAHDAGITHRDIKPSNLIITPRGEVKIIDFGLAKLAGQSRLTKSGRTPGTVAYMSPEQVQGKPVDQHTDIWSLGVVFYEMLYGRLPFTGDHEAALVFAIVNEHPEFMDEWDGRFPDGLKEIVQKSLAKNPAERYPHVEALADELKRVRLPDHSTASKTASPNLAKAPKSRLVKFGLLLTALIMLLTAGYHLFRSGVPHFPPHRSISAQRLAVLPFENLSPDRNDEYFTDGMTEEVIFMLSKIRGLRVIARTSVMQYKDTQKSIATIASELQVESLLEGSVRKSGNKIRVTVKLISAEKQEYLWTQDYERILQDVFVVQSDISSQVAEALKIRLLADEELRLNRAAIVNPEAHTNYLMGRYEWNKRTKAGAEAGIAFFHKALTQDSLFAPAYSGLADIYGFLGYYNLLPPSAAFPKAREAAQKALQIDDSDFEAHASLATIMMFYDYNLAGAKRELERALEINPGYASAHQWFAFYQMLAGRHEESLEQVKHAQTLDPFSPIMMDDIGEKLYYARRYDQAAAHLQMAASRYKDFFPIYFHLGLAHAQLREFDKAITAIDHAIALSGSHPGMVGARAWVYALAGNRAQVGKIMNELLQRGQKEYIPAYYFAMINAALGEADEFFFWLNKALEERSNWLALINIEPTFDPYRSDPRFQEIVKKMGFDAQRA